MGYRRVYGTDQMSRAKDWFPLKRTPAPPVGRRIVLARDVDRYPDFVARAGATGRIIGVDTSPWRPSEAIFIRARMDEWIPGAEPWDNEVHWFEDSLRDFKKDVLLLP